MMSERLIALRGRPPDVDLDTAESVAIEHYGIRARATALEGERDRNFRLDGGEGHQFVLKFIDPEADDTIVAGQSAALLHIAARDPGFPSPRLVRTREGKDLAFASTRGAGRCRVRVVTYLAGQLLQGSGPPDIHVLRSVGRTIARLDRALEDFSHAGLAQPIVWDIRQARGLLPVLAEVRSRALRELLQAALEGLDPLMQRLGALRSQAIHGDCHGRNLLIDAAARECVGIIDLGDMIEAPVALELAVTLAEFLTDAVADLRGAAEVIAGFASRHPLERGDIESLFDAIRIRIAVGVLVQTWRERNGAAPSPALESASAAALELLLSRGRDRLTDEWLGAAGIPSDLLSRRHRALGANAELSYERPLHLVRGEGVWVFNAEGERLLDVYNNVPHVGHAHPAVVEAIARQSRLIASNTRYLDERIIEYVERLTATLPPDLDACLFVNSGSEANDIAWRMAKSQTGRAGALVMKHAYHGITDAVTALSPAICAAVPAYVEQLAAPPHVDVDEAIIRLSQRGFSLAALIIDSAITSTGIYDPEPAWGQHIARAAHEAGGLVIADEVQYGLGRSGSHFWGFARRGYAPDIVTLGKPVGNGYPLGVVITRRSLLERFQRDTGFFSTFGGNPVAASAALAVLQVLETERLMDNARTTGDHFIGRLRTLARAHPAMREVRGHGLMIGVDVTDRNLTRRIVNGLRERGVLIGSEGPLGNVLKLRPPMPFRPEHADVVIEALSSTLSAVHP